ncbi:MAG: DUF5916 domain-containing protein [candidate division KSB1 bacterium]|nr:DUF5916 domain-containing protein [candidate division KSB1 bacterium]
MNWKVNGAHRDWSLNDLGFMHTADFISAGGEIEYKNNVPWWWFRSVSVSASHERQWTFGKEQIHNGTNLMLSGRLRNKWSVFMRVTRMADAINPRLLRGGPAMIQEGHWCRFLRIGTDDANKVSGGFGIHSHRHDDAPASQTLDFFPFLTFKPTPQSRLRAELDYSKSRTPFQYVEAEAPLYVLARLDRETIGITLRMDLSITPDFTIQFYGNPYFSTGQYSRFKSIDNPQADRYRDRYSILDQELAYSSEDEQFKVDADLDGSADLGFDDPDFNFAEFRSNVVARWEFKPGSTLFFVYTHGRSAYETITRSSFSHNVDNLLHTRPDNIFIIKLNVWFSV